MSVFADAVAELHADPDVSIACAWAPGWDREWPRALELDLQLGAGALLAEETPLRGIRSQPAVPRFGGQLGAIAERDEIDLAVADLPGEVLRGDLIAIGADRLVVEEAPRDVEGLTFNVVLSEA